MYADLAEFKLFAGAKGFAETTAEVRAAMARVNFIFIYSIKPNILEAQALLVVY